MLIFRSWVSPNYSITLYPGFCVILYKKILSICVLIGHKNIVLSLLVIASQYLAQKTSERVSQLAKLEPQLVDSKFSIFFMIFIETVAQGSGGCCKTRKYTPRTSYRNSGLKFGIVAKPLNKGACPLAQSLFELGFPHFLCFFRVLQQPRSACEFHNGGLNPTLQKIEGRKKYLNK